MILPLLIDHVVICQLTQNFELQASRMGKRKGKSSTLTKIDLSTLKPKPVATSQYAGRNGARVITTVHSVRRPLPPADPLGFDLDLANFNDDLGNFDEEPASHDTGEEGDSGGYHVAQVCPLFTSAFGDRLTTTRTTRFSYGGVNAIYFSKSSFDLKAGGCLPMIVASSVEIKACFVARIALPSNFFVEAA